MKYDIVIVGGGPAGLTAGLYASRAGKRTLLLEGGLVGGQAATTNSLENYPGILHIGGPELMMEMERQAKENGLTIESASVRSIDLREKTVLTKKAAYTADAIILATGAKRRRLGAVNEEQLTGNGVSYCATCDGALYRGKHAAIVGGGNTAIEDALYLSGVCDKVTIIHRRDQFRAEAHLSNRALGNAKIDVIWDSTVDKIEKIDGGVRLHMTSKNQSEPRTLDVAGVFIAVGTEPVSALYHGQLELDPDGYIRAGEDTHTEIPGVFAAGDLRKKPLRQVVTAASDGAVAASEAVRYLTEG